jgi:hypothetical protein
MQAAKEREGSSREIKASAPGAQAHSIYDDEEQKARNANKFGSFPK